MLDDNFMTKIKTESNLVWTGRAVEVCDGGCDYFDSQCNALIWKVMPCFQTQGSEYPLTKTELEKPVIAQ